MSLHVSTKTKRVRSCPSVPWHTTEIGDDAGGDQGCVKILTCSKQREILRRVYEYATRKAFNTDFIMENTSDQGRPFMAAKK